MLIEPGNLTLVHDILKKHVPEYEVRAFGSRVHGRHVRKFSDFDLVIMTEKRLEDMRLADLREAFVESDLPFKVDVLDWATVGESFRSRILESWETVYRPQ